MPLVAKAMAQIEYFKPILTEEDREHYMVMIGLGMSHAFGFSQAIVVNMTLGGSIYLADSLTEILQAIEKYRPTVWPSVPIWMKLIASDPQYQCYDITSLKCITCGAAPLPVEVLHKVEEITGAVITEGYGMTETVNTIAINGFHHRKSGTVGVPNPNIEYLVVDAEDGVTVMSDGADGEIICRGECVMHEYWQKPEESANMVRDGWLYTGDIGHVDEEGYLVIRDRKKDLIITSGFNVFPTEIEEVDKALPRSGRLHSDRHTQLPPRRGARRVHSGRARRDGGPGAGGGRVPREALALQGAEGVFHDRRGAKN